MPINLLLATAIMGFIGMMSGQNPQQIESSIPLILLAFLVELCSRRIPGIGYLSGTSAIYLAMAWQSHHGVRLMLLVSGTFGLLRLFKGQSGSLPEKAEESLLDIFPIWGSAAVVSVVQTFLSQELILTVVVGLLTFSILTQMAPKLVSRRMSEERLVRIRRNHSLLFSAPAFIAPLLLGTSSNWLVLLATPALCFMSFVKMDFEAEQQEQKSHQAAARLSKDLAKARRALNLKEEERVLMEELTRSFAEAKSLDETLKLAVNTIANLMATNSVVFFLKRSDGLLAPRAWSPRFQAGLQLEAGPEPIVEECWKSKKVILSQPHHFRNQRILIEDRFAVCLPLGQFGVLYVGRPVDKRYSRDQLLLLALLTAQTIPPVLAGLRQAELIAAFNQQVVVNKKLDQALSDLQESQALLVHSSKLAAVGQLSAGVAHEINTPLAAVVLSIQSAKRRIKKGQPEKVGEKLDDALEAAKVAKEIIVNLLEYARPGDDKVEVRNLNSIVKNALGIVGKLENVDIIEQLAADVEVEVNSIEIQQILTNLILNAQQAMSASESAVITVKSTLEGDRANIYVSDNGPGVPTEALERIFDPFFTTKPVGSGTGLGLSISLKLAERNRGSLEHVPAPKGACFKLSFPVWREPN